MHYKSSLASLKCYADCWKLSWLFWDLVEFISCTCGVWLPNFASACDNWWYSYCYCRPTYDASTLLIWFKIVHFFLLFLFTSEWSLGPKLIFITLGCVVNNLDRGWSGWIGWCWRWNGMYSAFNECRINVFIWLYSALFIFWIQK